MKETTSILFARMSPLLKNQFVTPRRENMSFNSIADFFGVRSKVL